MNLHKLQSMRYSTTCRQMAFVTCLLFIGLSAMAADLEVSINEVHYHPADDSREGEFVELFNYGDRAADLGGWLLIGGVQYIFPEGTLIPARSYRLVVNDRSAMLARYEISPGLILGEYTGSLANGGELLKLLSSEGYIVSFVEYDDTDPWPEVADGLGPSIERISPVLEETDPRAWRSSIAIGGSPGVQNTVFRDLESGIPPGPGSEDPLIPEASIWRFFRGESEPPATWRDIAFDDSSWESGTAGFGYDDGDDNTLLTDMQGQYSTVYVRREFQIPSPNAVEALTFRISFDDGFIAYLNGTEIGRGNASGQPGQTLPYDATADGNVGPASLRSIDLMPRSNLLVSGANVISVQGLNGTIQSRDFSLHPSLSGTITSVDQRQTLIALGSDWRFQKGTQPLPVNWNETDFDDSNWPSAPAGFGYGDGDDATVLDDMQGSYLTLYVRRDFDIEDPSLLVSLTLTVDYDDGFIAYLNGVEIARANVDGDANDDTALASHEAGLPEEFNIAAPGSVLLAGNNVLSIQGHNGTLDSSDFSLNAALNAQVSTEDDDDPPPPPDNWTRPPRDLVINEMFPGGVGDGWVEIYNPTDSTVDASGRKLHIYPEGRGSYEFAAGSLFAARSYLSVSEADLGFEIDSISVLLLSLDDGSFVDAMNPRNVGDGESVGRYPDGSDNRAVFVDPSPADPNTFDPELGIVINELMYHPASDNAGGEFIELYNRSARTIDLTGWSFTRGVTFNFVAGTSMAPGGYLVIAQDPAAVEARHGISAVHGPYQGSLSGDGETLLLRDARGNTADRVRYADEGSWPGLPDGEGPSAELIHPDLENRYGPAWRTSAAPEGTPGAENSIFSNDAAPIIVNVRNEPVIPTSADPVLVLATISDESGIDSAELFYRRDGNGAQVFSEAMLDDGIGDDGIAGNGVYGAEIPPQPELRIIRFWIEADDGVQATVVPRNFQDAPMLYQVEDDDLSSDESILRPIYRLIMTGGDLNDFRTRNVGSNVLLNCTFVADGRAYHNRGIRLRGNSARRCPPLSYRVQFDHDSSFQGIKRLNLNGCNAEKQWIGLDFLRRTNIPTPNAWYRKLSFNRQLETQYRLRVEAIDDSFLSRTLPGDDDGNLYRGESRANFDYRGESFGSYRGNYKKVTNESEDDYSDVVDISFRLDADTTSDEDFPAAVEERVDVVQWAHYFAAYAILGSTENSIVLNNGDDYYLYHRFSDDRWILLPWDLDSVFDESDQVLFRPTVDQIERVLEHPRYAPDYWCSLESMLSSAFQIEQVMSRIDHLAPLFSNNRVQNLRNFVSARRTYISNRIQSTLTVEVESGGSLCDQVLVPSGASVTLRGMAPGCGTTTVWVAGNVANYNPQSNQWSAQVDIAGIALIEIIAVYRTGQEIARLEIPVSNETAPTPIPANINSSTTLTTAGNPYRAGSDVFVASGARLTIEPGVTIIMDGDASLIISGTLTALGSEESPIRFVSEACDANWEGISFTASSSGNRLSFVEIHRFSNAEGENAGIFVSGTDLQLENVRIENNAGDLLRVAGGASVSIVNSTLASAATGIVLAGGDVEIRGSTLRDMTQNGIRCTSAGGSATIESSHFDAISGPALAARQALVVMNTTLITDCDVGLDSEDGGDIRADHLTLHDCRTGLRLRDTGALASLSFDSGILWQTTLAISADAGTDLSISYSNLEGGISDGEGNISDDPQLREPADGDYRLLPTSPCRGTGATESDMGAFPYEIAGTALRFQRCDANGDGANDLSDPVHTLLYLFSGGAESSCAIAADCNGDRVINLTDAIFDLNYLFAGGTTPQGPYPECEVAESAECATETCTR